MQQEVVLAMLARKPSHGYQLRGRLRQALGPLGEAMTDGRLDKFLGDEALGSDRHGFAPEEDACLLGSARAIIAASDRISATDPLARTRGTLEPLAPTYLIKEIEREQWLHAMG